MSNAREAIAAACQYISILKIENQNIEKQRDELLEALKATIKEFDGYTIHHISTIHGFSAANRIESTRAAIAKAEGKV